MNEKNDSFLPSDQNPIGQGKKDKEELKTDTQPFEKGVLQDRIPDNEVDTLLKRTFQELSAYKYALNESAIVTITDENGHIKHVNENFCKRSQHPREELLGQDLRIINSSYHDESFIRRLWETIAGGNIWKGEIKNKAKDGSLYWVDTTITPFLDDEGHVYQYVAIGYDITDRKKDELQKGLLSDISLIFNKEEGLKEMLREVLNLLIDFAGFALAEAWLISTDQKTISLKAQCARSADILDILKNSSQPDHFRKGAGLPGVTWEKQTLQFWNCLRSHSHFERKELAEEAGLKSAYGIPLFHNDQIIGVLMLGLHADKEPENTFSDLWTSLGKHIGAEVKRKRLEEELNQIFNSAPDIICIVGTDRYFKKVNPAMCALLGYSEQELLSSPLETFLHPDDFAASVSRMHGLRQASFRTLYFENRYLTKTGKIKWLAWTASKSSEEGFLFCVAKDIDEQKRNSIELEESEQRYSSLFHLSPQPMWVFDTETLHFLDVNDAAIRHYGFSREEFLAMTIKDIRSDAEVPMLMEALNLSRGSGHRTYHHTFRHRTKNEDVIVVDIQSTAISYKDRPAKVVLATDVTERYRYIAEIESHNKKLREISWIQSHVVRAPVARLMAFADLIKNFENSEAELQEMLQGILKSASEVDAIIKDISDRARADLS